jgi:hypothetical protein
MVSLCELECFNIEVGLHGQPFASHHFTHTHTHTKFKFAKYFKITWSVCL